MSTLHLDFETRSVLDLQDRGLANYARDKSTHVLMLAWAFDNDSVQLWQPHINPVLSREIKTAIESDVTLSAWNSTFERNIFRHVLGIELPVSRWIDPMVQARFLSMPGKLEKICEILNLSAELAKIEEGNRLIQKFCKPASMGGELTLFGISEPAFRDWNTDPRDWDLFCEYCKHDVLAEREILRRMAAFPLPEIEIRGWQLDQKINEAGLPVNMQMVSNAFALINQYKDELDCQQKKLTGLANPNSRDQLLPWLKERGYKFGSLGKAFVTLALAGKDLTAEARTALITRQESAKTSYKKLEAIQDIVSEDGRLRHQFLFLGAPRAGRWSGTGAQFQNQPRPSKDIEKRLPRALEVIAAGDYEAAKAEFPIVDLVTSCIRSVFQAPAGKKLVVGDLGAIENRVLGWASRCDAILQVFRDGRCPYLDFATKWLKIEYEPLALAYEAGDVEANHKRQISKPAVLGAGYGLGGGELKPNKYGDFVKTGLWGYAEQMGVEMTQEEAHPAVKVFRESYPEVVQFWRELENAAIHTLVTGESVTAGYVTFDRKRRKDGKFILRILLPSGRHLHYINAIVTERELEGNDGPYTKTAIMYDGIGHGAGKVQEKWGPTYTYGGKLCENICQAIARDILLDGMLRADERGAEIVGHVHDEAIVLSDDSPFAFGLDDLLACMTRPPAWASDLPLAADGFEAKVYRKG